MISRKLRNIGKAMVTVTAAAALTVACASPAPQSNEPQANGENDLVRVGVGPFLSFSPLWVAMDLGYFEQVGIDVELVSFLDGSMAVPPLLAGELEVAGLTMSAGLFNSMDRGANFKLVVGGGTEAPNSGVVALNVAQELADGGINGMADLAQLKGKKIGVTGLGSINQYVTAKALQSAGLDPRTDVEWVHGIPQPDMIGALASRQLDAANFAVDLAAAAENAGAGPVVVRGNEGAPGMQSLAYAMSDTFINDNTDVAERFTIALLKGMESYKLAHDDPDAYPEVLEAIAAHTTIKEAGKLRALHPWWPWVEGPIDAKSVLDQQDFWIYFDMVDNKVEEADLIDTKVLKAATEKLAANPDIITTD